MFERLLNEPPYSLRQSDKEAILVEGLNELTRHHYEKSPEYARILDAAWGGLKTYGSISEVPWLPVSLFKEMELKSTTLPAMVMRSSGTTGQRTSRIVIDNETARRQSEALVASFRPILERAACRFSPSTPRTSSSRPTLPPVAGACSA